jgi:hypothetical protein
MRLGGLIPENGAAFWLILPRKQIKHASLTATQLNGHSKRLGRRLISGQLKQQGSDYVVY